MAAQHTLNVTVHQLHAAICIIKFLSRQLELLLRTSDIALAASAADVGSILSIPGRDHQTTVRKQEYRVNYTRYVISPSAPSLAAQLSKSRPKQKPTLVAL
jgi:hypothetical protein